MGDSSAIDELLDNRYLRRGAEGATGPWPVLSSGFPTLDALLSGGWPRGTLIELLPETHGIGEFSLLLPALVRLTADPRSSRPWVVLVAPPCIPYAPALDRHGLDLSRLLVVRATGSSDVLWAAEQALRSGLCAALLAWCGRAQPVALRRLALAAAEDGALVFLFRPPVAQHRPSPAALRIRLRPVAGLRVAAGLRPATGDSLGLEIFRNRSGRVPAALVIALPDR